MIAKYVIQDVKLYNIRQHIGVVTTQPHTTMYVQEPVHVIGPDTLSTTMVTEHTVHNMGPSTYVTDYY